VREGEREGRKEGRKENHINKRQWKKRARARIPKTKTAVCFQYKHLDPSNLI
jgi:hypothetical protein